MLFKSHTLSINGKEFYFNCEDPEELALEVVWEDKSMVKLLFGIMTVLDLSDTHMESLLTHYTCACLDDILLNPNTSEAQLSQHITGVQFQDTRFHRSKGFIRLFPHSRGAENHKGLWSTAFLALLTGKQELVRADVEGLLFYTISAQTSVNKLSHKIA